MCRGLDAKREVFFYFRSGTDARAIGRSADLNPMTTEPPKVGSPMATPELERGLAT
jgi:hypothetical protein